MLDFQSKVPLPSEVLKITKKTGKGCVLRCLDPVATLAPVSLEASERLWMGPRTSALYAGPGLSGGWG